MVELLLVVALLGIVASTVAVGVTSGDAGARLADARAAVREIDAVARAAAPRAGQLALRVEECAFVLRREPGGEVLAERALPEGFGAELVTAAGDRSVVFERQGTSPSYSVLLRGGGSVVDLVVNGRTGWIGVPR